MSRTNRVIFEGSLYEIVPRAREGLPLPPTELTRLLQMGILARAQRDDKVTLCNFVDMNNHSHQHCIPNNPELFSKFYMEYQKKVTDTVRKLTRRRQLNLWEGRPNVALVAGLEDAIDRLVYLFMNPCRAGLVNRIEEFPGLNTWNAFTSCEPSIDATVIFKAKWIPVSKLVPLPTDNRLSAWQDITMTQHLRDSEHGIEYDLTIKPLAWLRVFGITDPSEIDKVRREVVRRVREEEHKLITERASEQRPVIGAQRLQRQQFMMPHTPKQKERKIFIVCKDRMLRPRIIKLFKEILAKCRSCYDALKKGLPHEWPPGTFIPWIPPAAYHRLRLSPAT